MTPLYVGIPVDPSSKLGGGYVLGAAFNTNPSNVPMVPFDPHAHYAVELEGLPTRTVMLSELTAASSNFGAAFEAIVSCPDARFVLKQTAGTIDS